MMKQNLENILSKYPANKKDGLIPILQEVQQQHGHLTEELLAEVGRYLDLPANKVYGVATFYDHFRFHPHGQYHIRICRGTACHLAGSSRYLEEIETQLKVRAGSISKDRKFSLEITNCMGACESAPVIRVNDTFHIHADVAGLEKLIHSLKEKAE